MGFDAHIAALPQGPERIIQAAFAARESLSLFDQTSCRPVPEIPTTSSIAILNDPAIKQARKQLLLVGRHKDYKNGQENAGRRQPTRRNPGGGCQRKPR